MHCNYSANLGASPWNWFGPPTIESKYQLNYVNLGPQLCGPPEILLVAKVFDYKDLDRDMNMETDMDMDTLIAPK